MAKTVASTRGNLDPQEMRVLFVLPRMVAGGVERATLNLIEGLKRHNVHCHLALGRAYGELLDEARSLVDIDETARSSNWLFAFGVMHVIRRYRPTHIITAFADVTCMTLVARFFVNRRLPVIMGIHGTLRDVAGKGPLRIRLRYQLNKLLAKWVYPRCAAIIAVSNGVAADIKKVDPSSYDRLTVIHNPVFSNVMDERLCELSAKPSFTAPFRLVSLGRLAFEKGFDVLIRALPLVMAEYDVHLDIYGEGRERARLQALIEEHQLMHRVVLKGATRDPFAALSTCDVFVFPSRNEGFGVALVEALACGKQIVASNCLHGPAEILEDGAFGQLVEPENPEALANAIKLSLSGKVRFSSELLRARAKSYSADVAVTSYMALLQRLTP